MSETTGRSLCSRLLSTFSAEFISHMLVSMGKVDKTTVKILARQFKYMDVDGSGYLDEADLKVFGDVKLDIV
jgi:hypothetical protein